MGGNVADAGGHQGSTKDTRSPDLERREPTEQAGRHKHFADHSAAALAVSAGGQRCCRCCECTQRKLQISWLRCGAQEES